MHTYNMTQYNRTELNEAVSKSTLLRKALDHVVDSVPTLDEVTGGSGISNVVEDTTPQLGGNLDVNGHNIGSVTPTQLGYVVGVTSAIQTQLDAKASSSSLTTHTSNTSNPHSVTKSQVGLSNVGNIKNNLIAGPAVPPGPTNDTTEGYSHGSLWSDVDQAKVYHCLDATEDAADWIELKTSDNSVNVTGDMSGPAASNDETEGYKIGDIWIDQNIVAAYICVDATEDAAVWAGPIGAI